MISLLLNQKFYGIQNLFQREGVASREQIVQEVMCFSSSKSKSAVPSLPHSGILCQANLPALKFHLGWIAQ
jgi:hypothetical protein